jgi:adsorption protein B
LINFFANCRAVLQILKHDSVRRVAWDKTMHDFPVLGNRSARRRPLGQILLEQNAITDTQLSYALAYPSAG